MNLIWNSQNTPAELHSVLRTLGEEYPVKEGADGVNLCFEPDMSPDTLRVTQKEGKFTVVYGKVALAARGVAYALSGQECEEKSPFRTYGVLFDCTRGNIITVKHFKHWLRRIALFGYNMVLVYVKDAYQVPGEPYFGYMRGAYSMEEIREMDDYARKLGIEMIASIQALGHLEPIMRWAAYAPIKDTASAIMVDEPKSYELLEKMIRFWSDALSSRRIHLGMDETHDLGRGRFMDRNGYENPFNIYNRHLTRICKMCEEMELKPIIWSDMFFRYANKKQDYYDTSSVVPEEVKKAIPRMVQLSYWDYYHRESGIYETMLTKTGELNGSAPFMASGVWTWYRFWTDFEQTAATVRPCVDACRKTGVEELIYTLWGDDGGYCEFDSAFASLAWAADYAFNTGEDKNRIGRLYGAVCGTSYDLQILCGELCYTTRDSKGNLFKVACAPMMWDDPLMAIAWRDIPGVRPGMLEDMLDNYKRIQTLVSSHRDDCAAGMPDYVWNLTNVLIHKMELRRELEEAYKVRDIERLRNIADKGIPEVLNAIDAFLEVFRRQWRRSFKPFGMELMQIRLGGQSERYRELARVITELADGQADTIPELEIDHTPTGHFPSEYLRTATGGFFI